MNRSVLLSDDEIFLQFLTVLIENQSSDPSVGPLEVLREGKAWVNFSKFGQIVNIPGSFHQFLLFFEQVPVVAEIRMEKQGPCELERFGSLSQTKFRESCKMATTQPRNSSWSNLKVPISCGSGVGTEE